MRRDWATQIALAGLVLLGLAGAWLATRPPVQLLPPECVDAYRHVRTALDTAVADAVRPHTREASPLTCGERRLLRRSRSQTGREP